MRQATPDDQPAVVQLTEAAYAPYTEAFGAPPLPVTEDYAPRIARGEVHVVDGTDGLAAAIVLERHADYAVIYSLAVDPARQGQKLGSTLLRFAEDTARNWAVPELRLYTNALMTRNIAIYQAAGYRETGRRGHPLRPGFTLVDMVKPLAAPLPATR